jgi:hypothetical protein
VEPARDGADLVPRAATYELPALNAALRRALADDDDVLTQFHEAAEIEVWLAQASSFDEVVAALEGAY